MVKAQTSSDRCLICGYDVSGLKDDVVCPECTALVGDSRHGGLIASAPKPYIERLIHSAIVIEVATLIAMAVRILLFAVLEALTPDVFDEDLMARTRTIMAAVVGGAVLTLILEAVISLCWWRLSTPDPRYQVHDRASSMRRVLRVSLVAFVLIGVAVVIGMIWWMYFATANVQLLYFWQGMIGLKFLVLLFNLVVMALYIRVLAGRLGASRLYAWARWMLWLAPLLAIVLLVLEDAVPSFLPSHSNLAGIIMVTVSSGVWLVVWVGMIDLTRQSLVRARGT